MICAADTLLHMSSGTLKQDGRELHNYETLLCQALGPLLGSYHSSEIRILVFLLYTDHVTE